MKKGMVAVVLAAVVALAMGLLVPSTSYAQQNVTLRLHTKMPPESPEGLGFQRFADLIEEYSEGQINVIVYPAEQLGGTDVTLEQLQAGTIHIYAESGSYLERYVPEMGLSGMPFLFRDREQWVTFQESEQYQAWAEEVAQQHNIRILGLEADFIRGPYRVLVSNRPIKSFEDLQGLRVRMPPIDTQVAVWRAIGTVPEILEWTDVYESIARGVVDAATSPIALVESMAFHEVAPYIYRTDEYPQGIAFMMNNDTWESLSPELQEAVLRAHADASAFSREIMGQAAEESIERMVAAGVTYSEDLDTTPMRDAAWELYRQWEEEGRIPEGFLEFIESL